MIPAVGHRSERLPCSPTLFFAFLFRTRSRSSLQACANTNRPQVAGREPPGLQRNGRFPSNFPPRLPFTAHLMASPPCKRAASSLSGRKDLGNVPGAGRPSAFHLEEMLHFSPLTQKNMVLRKLVFSTESSQRKKNWEEEQLPTSLSSDSQKTPAPEGCSSLGGEGRGAACRGPAAGGKSRQRIPAPSRRTIHLLGEWSGQSISHSLFPLWPLSARAQPHTR